MSSRGNKEAFPRPYFSDGKDCCDVGASGMTMREWYAGMALQGLLAAGGVTMGQGDEDYQAPAARAAFAYADAMIKESGK